MSKIGEIWRRLEMFARREAFGRDLEEEMRLHRVMKERELIAGGADSEEARYAAARAFGNATSLQEGGREAWGWRWLEDVALDLRYGARTLLKNLGFAATAILTLALGIGANTAIFSVVNTVLLQPLPYRDPGRLVWADEFMPRMNDNVVPNPEYTNWKLNNRTFAAMAALGGQGPINLTEMGKPEQIDQAQVTPNLLDTLGVQPALGRAFSEAEGQPGGRLAAILSDGLWRRKFGADPNIIGRGISLNQESYTIVGVLPAGSHFPRRGFQPDIMTAFQLPPKVDWATQRMSLTQVIGRLKPGVSLDQAHADLATLSQQTNSAIPTMFVHMRDGLQVHAIPLHQKLVGDVRPTLLMLLVAVGVVLLIACVNIANLQLARTANRQKELAVRSAIGASRTRLLRQLLTEGALIALLGGLLGLAGAAGGVRLLQSYAPQNFLQAEHITMDRWVLLFTLGITGVTVALFGAIPSWRASNPDVDARLDGRDTATRGTGQRSLRNALATCELALAVVLVAASGLLIRSFVLLSNVHPGFDANHVLTVATMLPPNKYRDAAQRNTFYDQVLRKMRAMPGVRSAGLTTSLPLTNFTQMRTFGLEGQPDKPLGQTPPVTVEDVSPGYFEMLRMPLLAGRVFDERDAQFDTHVVIANQAFVQKYFGNKDAVGKRMRFGAGHGEPQPWDTIVGVVGNVRHAKLDREADPEVFTPFGRGGMPETFAGFALRTEGDPRSLVAAVRDAVLEVHPEQPIFDARAMEDRIAEAASGTRFNATLLGFFGFVALALAAVGVYGVIAYSVAERTHEIGIRVALGASREDVAGMVMGQGMLMTVVGLVVGLAGAVFATRFLSGLLYGIQPRDPLVLGAAALVLGVVAMMACWVPARRAMRVDPMVALRHE
jgi:putative ABC transport system permease protein